MGRQKGWRNRSIESDLNFKNMRPVTFRDVSHRDIWLIEHYLPSDDIVSIHITTEDIAYVEYANGDCYRFDLISRTVTIFDSLEYALSIKDWEDNEKFKAMLADKIFHEMNKRNMNARALAQRTGISDKMISNYLWAKQMPSAINCMRIADALDIDMNELFNFF